MSDVVHVDPRETPECVRYREIIKTPLATLRALPEAELIQRIDELLAVDGPTCSLGTMWQLGPDDYRDELNRRAADSQTAQLVVLTKFLVILTLVLVFATGPLVFEALLPYVGERQLLLIAVNALSVLVSAGLTWFYWSQMQSRIRESATREQERSHDV